MYVPSPYNISIVACVLGIDVVFRKGTRQRQVADVTPPIKPSKIYPSKLQPNCPSTEKKTSHKIPLEI